ncbi:dihydrofolate reductase [Frisingicoccus sp.]|uniref:dihydrofolate reductase n=1 Tax=Frisingicoccus sp. TaxID=1918627 RepID=UPI0025BF8DCB|nr:dihydrofolate reductase [Frisingicoccus sp.]MDD6233053.1 dihydrofolate reductase [Frisingicoccus sp.]MDY5957694.1 dihydrofolate reductase [Frisingicoccus sp.]
MNIIVAVDKNWAIGFENKLLNSIPEDMKFFRETTTGKVVVMGRKTLESFPNKRPLKNRTNIVITRQKDYQVDGAVVLHSVEEALDYLKQFKSEDIYVIGGASIYEQMLPYCDVAHVTVMDYAYQADTWFPNLDKMEEFVVAADSEEKTYFDLEYCFKMYVRKSKLKEIVDFID